MNFHKKCSTKEFKKAQSIYVLFVPFCRTRLVPQVPCFIMLLCQTCPQMSRALRALVSHVSRVSLCVLVLHVPHALRSLILLIPTCLVLSCQTCLMAYVFPCFTCLVH